jgi:VanZ family protein
MKLKHVFTGLMVVYIIVLTVFATMEHPEKVVPTIGYDKILHFFEFFLLGILLMKTLMLYTVKYPALIYASIAFIIAVFSEVIQLGSKTRTFSVYDLFADFLGLFVAFIIVKVVMWKS